jgi:hypothetical protein
MKVGIRPTLNIETKEVRFVMDEDEHAAMINSLKECISFSNEFMEDSGMNKQLSLINNFFNQIIEDDIPINDVIDTYEIIISTFCKTMISSYPEMAGIIVFRLSNMVTDVASVSCGEISKMNAANEQEDTE